jgi:hypothetical protein
MNENAQDEPNVQPNVQPDAPGAELLANGDVADKLRVVLNDLTQRPTRNAQTGQFVQGGLKPGTTLAHSEVFWTAVEGIKRDLVVRVLSDLGQDAAEVMLGVVDAYVEARLLRQSTFLRLAEQGGPVTGKGKRRALASFYLAVFAAELNAAAKIGFGRKARDVFDSPLDWCRAQDSRQSGDSTEPQAAGATIDDQARV